MSLREAELLLPGHRASHGVMPGMSGEWEHASFQGSGRERPRPGGRAHTECEEGLRTSHQCPLTLQHRQALKDAPDV